MQNAGCVKGGEISKVIQKSDMNQSWGMRYGRAMTGPTVFRHDLAETNTKIGKINNIYKILKSFEKVARDAGSSPFH